MLPVNEPSQNHRGTEDYGTIAVTALRMSSSVIHFRNLFVNKQFLGSECGMHDCNPNNREAEMARLKVQGYSGSAGRR